MLSVIIATAVLFSEVRGHGRLTVPTARKPTGYEDDPVGGGPGGNNHEDWVCRNLKTEPATTLTAGQPMTVHWTIGAEHPGDCDAYISYDWDLDGDRRSEMKWLKIANWLDCNDLWGEDQIITLPAYLPAADRAVFRWGWWGLHNWPTVEFFVQCADIKIISSSPLTVADLAADSYPLIHPGDDSQALFPHPADTYPGYFYPYGGKGYPWDDDYMTGPPCARGYEGNNCWATATGTYGSICPSGVDCTGNVDPNDPTDPPSSTCTCANGVEATGATCSQDGAEICTSCDAGYSLNANLCTANVCTCSDGVAVTGSACTSNNANMCASCDGGFFLSGTSCVTDSSGNQCSCSNGFPHPSCDFSGQERCSSCHYRFKLDNELCVESTTCDVTIGSAANGWKYNVIYVAWMLESNMVNDIRWAVDHGYNVINLAFLVNGITYDAITAWGALDAQHRLEALNYAHAYGAVILLSAGGGTDHIDDRMDEGVTGLQYGTVAANKAHELGLDGVDFDLELNPGNHAPFLDGSMQQFMTEATLAAAAILGECAIISHAPQSPYASPWAGQDAGYASWMLTEAGQRVNFINLQYYNQGGIYATPANIFKGDTQFEASIHDLVSAGVPMEKLVVGKLVNPNRGWTGYVTPADLNAAACSARTSSDMSNLASGFNTGFMVWVYDSGNKGEADTWSTNVLASCGLTPPTDPPTDPVTSAPTDPVTSAPTDPVTSAPTDPVTSAPTDPVTSAPTDPVTSAPTDPVTSAPTDPVTSAPTDPSGATCTNSVWSPCGGRNWQHVPQCCPSGNYCCSDSEWYSQCLSTKNPNHVCVYFA